MSVELDHGGAPGDARVLLARIDNGWREVLDTIEGVPDARLEEPGACGEWSAKNLMGHLAFWDDHVLGEIERALAGQAQEAVNFQALNDADEAARKRRTLAEEREAMHRAHAAVIARLDRATGVDAAQLAQAIGRHTYEHYAAHAEDLQRWRQRVGV